MAKSSSSNQLSEGDVVLAKPPKPSKAPTTDAVALTRPPGRPVLNQRQDARADIEVRRLLEDDIGLDVVEEALQLAVAAEPEPPAIDDRNPHALPLRPSKFRLLLERMQDPRLTGSQSITTLIRSCNVTPFEILRLVNERNVSFALARSAQRMDNILRALETAAEIQLVDCRRCAGGGQITEPDTKNADFGEPLLEQLIDCPDCAGTGKLQRLGSIDAQKLFFSIHGLGPKGQAQAATTINVSAQAAAKSGSDGVPKESVIARVERIIGGSHSSSGSSDSSD